MQLGSAHLLRSTLIATGAKSASQMPTKTAMLPHRLQIKPLTREHDFTVNTDKAQKPRKVTPLSAAPDDDDWISSCL